MTHFLAMGGYGGFVWSAYGVSAMALTATVALTLQRYFHAMRQLRLIQSGNEKRFQ